MTLLSYDLTPAQAACMKNKLHQKTTRTCDSLGERWPQLLPHDYCDSLSREWTTDFRLISQLWLHLSGLVFLRKSKSPADEQLKTPCVYLQVCAKAEASVPQTSFILLPVFKYYHVSTDSRTGCDHRPQQVLPCSRSCRSYHGSSSLSNSSSRIMSVNILQPRWEWGLHLTETWHSGVC